MSKKRNWRFERSDRESQRIWSRERRGKTAYYLADQSGDTLSDGVCLEGNPDSTDDGPLRVDPKRMACLVSSFSVHFLVPVISERDGKRKAHCGCSPQVFDALQKLMPELQVDLDSLSARWKALASIVKRVEG